MTINLQIKLTQLLILSLFSYWFCQIIPPAQSRGSETISQTRPFSPHLTAQTLK